MKKGRAIPGCSTALLFLVISCMAGKNRTMLYFSRVVCRLPDQDQGGCLLATQVCTAMDSHQVSDAVITKFPAPPRESYLRDTWRGWGDMLRRRRLAGLAAWLLEAGRPLALVSAQFLYMGWPLFGPGAATLAKLLESEDNTTEFLAYLGSGGSGSPGMRRGDA